MKEMQAYLVDTGADPGAHKAVSLELAMVWVEKNAVGLNAVIWYREIVEHRTVKVSNATRNHYQVAKVWRNNCWIF